jgi:GAF domain-containing protein
LTYLVIYLFVVGLAFVRRLDFRLRAWGLLLLGYAAGVIAFARGGLAGDGRVFLLALPVLTLILVGARSALLMAILSMLTFVAFALTAHLGWMTDWLVRAENPLALQDWVSAGAAQLLLLAVVMALLWRFYRFQTTTLQVAHQTTADLAQAHAYLRDRAGELEEANRLLAKRSKALAAAADVSRAAASILELEPLTRQVVELVRERFGLYYVGLFLLDDVGEYAVLEAGTGEAGHLMKERRHRLEVGGTSMVGAACAQRQACVASDIDVEPPQDEASSRGLAAVDHLLPDTRSSMAVPLMVGDHVLGALDLQSTQPDAFSEEDIAVLQLVADQVAVAVDNARKVSEEATLLEATSPIYRLSRRLAAATTTDEVTAVIIDSVAGTEADGCVVVEFEFAPTDEPEALSYLGVWRRDREPQFQPGMRLPIAESPFPLEMVSTLWTVPDAERDERLPSSAREVFAATGARALTNIPLRSGEKVFGQVVVLRTVPGPFTDTTMRLYETLSDQASVALERVRLLEETQRRAEREQMIGQMTVHFTRSLDVNTLLQTAMRELGQLPDITEVSIHVRPPGESLPQGSEGRETYPSEEAV